MASRNPSSKKSYAQATGSKASSVAGSDRREAQGALTRSRARDLGVEFDETQCIARNIVRRLGGGSTRLLISALFSASSTPETRHQHTLEHFIRSRKPVASEISQSANPNQPWQTWKGTAVARMNPGVTILFLDMAASYGLGGQSRVNNDHLRQPPHPSRFSWTSIACKGAAGHLSANSSSAHQREQL
nr:uncharacterized protein LOC109173837 isoform X1 [Ipomoea batatas]